MRKLLFVLVALMLVLSVRGAAPTPTTQPSKQPAAAPTNPPIAEPSKPPRAVPTMAPTAAAQRGAPSGERATLLVAFAGTVEQMDPNYALGSPTAQTVVSNIYDQLTEYQTYMSKDGYLVDDQEKIVGGVARFFEISPDYRTITYRIREGLKFHDGTPLDAAAVKFTFDRIVETKGAAYSYVDLAGARSTSDYQVVNDKTVVVKLEKPNILAMKSLTLQNISPVNPKLVKTNATAEDPFGRKWMAINAAGSGPFMLESWNPTSEVVLKRFDGYWKGPAKLEKVIIKIIPTVADRILALEKGAVDMIMEVPAKNVARLKSNPDVKMISAPSIKQILLGMSHDIPPFNNVKVRQAIAYAAPYDTILNEVYRGYAKRLRSPGIVSSTPTYTEKYWTYETDLNKAKALLTEAGFPNGFQTTLAVRAGNEEDEEAAVWIRANLEKVGIRVDIKPMPLAAWLTEARAYKHPMYMTNHGFWINDPFYSFYFAIRTGGGPNYTNYKNEEVNKLIANYFPSTDVEARKKASDRIQQITARDVPIIPLVQVNVNVAMRKNVQGYYFSFDGVQVTRFYTMYKE